MGKNNDFIGFFKLASKLKENKRMGWVLRKVEGAESVADHSFRLALMAMVLAKKCRGVNASKAVKMALVHDLPEAITGDIPRDFVDDYENSLGIKPSMTLEQKRQLEERAMQQIAKELGNEKEIQKLWREFEEQKTLTARFVKELEPIELLLQALEYKEKNPENKSLNDFFYYTKKFKRIRNPQVKRILVRITREFEALEKA